ncbi:MAG: hypothetical protein NT021_01045 [Sphingobacteriales bacterium]|nr:hypothetical protein [Sphingobacteriales bacterium]
MKKPLIFLVFVLIACTDLEYTRCYTYMQNDSSHHISVKSYFMGSLTPFLSFDLLPNEKKEVLSRQSRGLGSGESYALMATGEDSILVIFDNVDTIIHYRRPELVNPNKKYILFESPRNLYNSANYVKKTINKTAYHATYSYSYAFTEQDYLDAKQ